MKNYTQLTRDERYYIEVRKANVIGISGRQLAREMGRSHTTINRELKRNTDPSFGFYSGLRANNLALEVRKTVVRKPFLMRTIADATKAFIIESLQEKTSPEQICGRLKLKHGIRISITTLYRYIDEDKNNGGQLYKNLMHGKKKYRRKANKDNAPAAKNKKNISERPAVANLKQEPGHWEFDTIFGLDQKSYLLTLTDKASKFEIIRKIPNKEAATVLAAMRDIVATTLLPFKTITSDNGTEFAAHEAIAELTKAAFYFADPYSSWQRGLNEHQNGLVRVFFPKGFDFRDIDDSDVKKVENNLNNRPRKALGFLTPAEVMFNYVVHGQVVHLHC
jgi:transposase, IS30 family